MHIPVVAEGFIEGLKHFEEQFNGKEYLDGKCKLRVREIKLYNLGFNECGYKEVLKDLKAFARYNEDIDFKGQKNTTTELHSVFQKYLKWFRKFFKMIKPIEKDLDKVKANPVRETYGTKGIWFNTIMTPIGKINDYKNDKGEELV